MTNKEAVKLIREIEEDGRNVTSEHIKALDLATRALEKIDLIKFNIHALNKLIEEADHGSDQ